MSAAAHLTTPGTRWWLTEDDCDLADFRTVVEVDTDRREYPHAEAVEQGVLVYDSGRLRALARKPSWGRPARRALRAELAAALLDGPGIIAFRGAFDDPGVVDRATEAFETLIAEQHAAGGEAGDHFAPPGANDRVWNAAEKLALHAPEVFADYYANDIVALAAEAWLGPGYQLTSQVNVVNPGGRAQNVHRDYHLGFLSTGQAGEFPAAVHRLSPVLTLQGAVAHCDMPVESGPTLYLPHSQKYEPGYLAWRRPEFIDYFDTHHVQLPLSRGDAVFFNPALFHAAGHNHSTDIKRMANLLQISSAFGRAMESVDRTRMVEALYPALLRMAGGEAGSEAGGGTGGGGHAGPGTGAEGRVRRVVAAAAEGYAFPTNLDRDQPVGGLAPEAQSQLVRRAVREAWTPGKLRRELTAWTERRRTGGTGEDVRSTHRAG